VSDPVASGIVARLDRPSGNITGFGLLEPSLGGKWLELLSEIAPGLKRVAMMFNPDLPPAAVYMPSLETAARSLKVELIMAPVHSDAEIETTITALGREPGGGLFVMADGFTFPHRVPIISAAARNNVPAVYSVSEFVRDGGLLSYGADSVDIWRRAASYVDRILRGDKPAELPVQLPTRFEMVVNRKAATALGLAIPPSIMLRADEGRLMNQLPSPLTMPLSRHTRRRQFLIVFAALLAAPAASAQVGNAPFCLATDSMFGGVPSVLVSSARCAANESALNKPEKRHLCFQLAQEPSKSCD
jgi:hypothetical protein